MPRHDKKLLASLFAELNLHYFRGKLPSNTKIALVPRNEGHIACFICRENTLDVDTIAIGRNYRPLGYTLSDIVLHEMIHQWIHHFYKGRDWWDQRMAHGKQFKRHFIRIRRMGGFSQRAIAYHKELIIEEHSGWQFSHLKNKY